MEVDYKELSEILTPEQIKEITRFVKENKSLEPTSLEFTKKLKELLRKWEKELMEKGIYPDYLAYAISYLLSKYPYETRVQILKIQEEKAKKRLGEVS